MGSTLPDTPVNVEQDYNPCPREQPRFCQVKIILLTYTEELGEIMRSIQWVTYGTLLASHVRD